MNEDDYKRWHNAECRVYEALKEHRDEMTEKQTIQHLAFNGPAETTDIANVISRLSGLLREITGSGLCWWADNPQEILFEKHIDYCTSVHHRLSNLSKELCGVGLKWIIPASPQPEPAPVKVEPKFTIGTEVKRTAAHAAHCDLNPDEIGRVVRVGHGGLLLVDWGDRQSNICASDVLPARELVSRDCAELMKLRVEHNENLNKMSGATQRIEKLKKTNRKLLESRNTVAAELKEVYEQRNGVCRALGMRVGDNWSTIPDVAKARQSELEALRKATTNISTLDLRNENPDRIMAAFIPLNSDENVEKVRVALSSIAASMWTDNTATAAIVLSRDTDLTGWDLANSFEITTRIEGEVIGLARVALYETEISVELPLMGHKSIYGSVNSAIGYIRMIPKRDHIKEALRAKSPKHPVVAALEKAAEDLSDDEIKLSAMFNEEKDTWYLTANSDSGTVDVLAAQIGDGDMIQMHRPFAKDKNRIFESEGAVAYIRHATRSYFNSHVKAKLRNTEPEGRFPVGTRVKRTESHAKSMRYDPDSIGRVTHVCENGWVDVDWHDCHSTPHSSNLILAEGNKPMNEQTESPNQSEWLTFPSPESPTVSMLRKCSITQVLVDIGYNDKSQKPEISLYNGVNCMARMGGLSKAEFLSTIKILEDGLGITIQYDKEELAKHS